MTTQQPQPDLAHVVFLNSPRRLPNANLSQYKFMPFPKNFDDREYLNTSYYNNSNFDLRSGQAKCGGMQNLAKIFPTNLVPCGFENQQKRTYLVKFSNEDRTNVFTNTRSFAGKFARSAPKFKVMRVRKPKELEPGLGYYDG